MATEGSKSVGVKETTYQELTQMAHDRGISITKMIQLLVDLYREDEEERRENVGDNTVLRRP